MGYAHWYIYQFILLEKKGQSGTLMGSSVVLLKIQCYNRAVPFQACKLEHFQKAKNS